MATHLANTITTPAGMATIILSQHVKGLGRFLVTVYPGSNTTDASPFEQSVFLTYAAAQERWAEVQRTMAWEG